MNSVPFARDGLQDRSPWPAPPFEWPHVAPPRVPGPQACRIEMVEGGVVDAFAADIDPEAREWQVAMRAAGPFIGLPMARIRRVTLEATLTGALRSLELGPALVPVAAQRREYTCLNEARVAVLKGHTVGHVRRPCGLFLFAPQDDARGLRRVFVPASAFHRVEFGPTMQELASDPWIVDVRELWLAVEAQRSKPIPRLGEVLVRLGLADATQVDAAVARKGDARPLGEKLVADGVMTLDELQTAIAVKLGFPLVDLRRFPVDPACARRLPTDVALRHGAIPIASDGQRLAIAVDSPRRIMTLEDAKLLPRTQLVPVIAPMGQIRLALAATRQDDDWTSAR
jgi:hypothetical protein